MDLNLKGAKALVTGGSRGIGASICRALAKEGASIATCARGQEGLDKALNEYRGYGVDAYGAALDVRNPEQFSQWVSEAADQLGGIDIVVSNVSTRVDPASESWWLDTFEADLMQHVRLRDACLPHLQNSDKASMVFVASIASVMTTLPPHEEAYGAMKAGLVNLVGQWSAIFAHKGIRVNAVSPGPIYFEGGWWDMVKQKDPDSYKRAASLAAMGRLGDPTEIADAVAFLASPRSSFTTGINLRIDGGLVKTANF